MASHMLGSLAQAGRLAIHLEARGRDDHHTAEAAFKAVGRSLREALAPGSLGVPSTKGHL
jgi:imidazoleglycerol phosphate dehydratase HisB